MYTLWAASIGRTRVFSAVNILTIVRKQGCHRFSVYYRGEPFLKDGLAGEKRIERRN